MSKLWALLMKSWVLNLESQFINSMDVCTLMLTRRSFYWDYHSSLARAVFFFLFAVASFFMICRLKTFQSPKDYMRFFLLDFPFTILLYAPGWSSFRELLLSALFMPRITWKTLRIHSPWQNGCIFFLDFCWHKEVSVWLVGKTPKCRLLVLHILVLISGPSGNSEVSRHKTNKGHPPSFLFPKLTSDCVDTLNNANHN